MMEPSDLGVEANVNIRLLRRFFMDDESEARQNELLDQILVSVWNARGAADLSAMDTAHKHVPVPQHLVRAIKEQDR